MENDDKPQDPNEIYLRCVQCDHELTYAAAEGLTSCPACGTKSLPLSPKKDRTIKINTHELRILTIWASNWAGRHCDPSAQKTLACIIQRLTDQLGDLPLTMAQEFKDLQKVFPSAEVMIDGVVQKKDQPS